MNDNYIDLNKVSDDCTNWYEDMNEEKALNFLIDPSNNDLGGTLSLLLIGHPQITQIQYEIIKLQTYNKIMEKVKK